MPVTAFQFSLRSVFSLFIILGLSLSLNLVAFSSSEAISLEALFGIAVPEDPLPKSERSWTDADVDALVEYSYESIYSPLTGEAAAAPSPCDDIHFLRMKVAEAGPDASDADAILLMMPGIYEGANGFEYIGRQLVYIGKTQYGKNFEVWGVDRRANCIEDLTGFQEAEAQATADEAAAVLLDYYYFGGDINGKTFDGFLRFDEVPYLGHFGLELSTRDMYTIMETMIPDPAVRKEKVFVGGHSLGGIHASVFAAWDKDGDPNTPEDAGYNNTAGLFGFDTIVSPTAEVAELMTALVPLDLGFETRLTREAYNGVKIGFESGVIPPVLPLLLDSELTALPEALGILVSKAPEAENTIINELPISFNADLGFRFFHSRYIDDALSGISLLDFRYTNEAMLGLIFDDNQTPIGFLQTSLGFLKGGSVGDKPFPIPSVIGEVPLIGSLLSGLGGPDEKFIATDKGRRSFFFGSTPGPLYSFAEFDEVANLDNSVYKSQTGYTTFTTAEKEMVDIGDFARSLHFGESNFTEWYFPLRIAADVVASAFPYGPEFGINTFHRESAEALPQIEFIGEDGVVAPLMGPVVPRGDRTLIPGMNHVDPMFAVANAPDRYENPVINPLIEFVLENLE